MQLEGKSKALTTIIFVDILAYQLNKEAILIKFYTNRELAEKLGINLAKWKRWSRKFLPPDPLGGLQSGFARQYTLADAFLVHLGGTLVSDLKFTLPEASLILNDLRPWLIENGFMAPTGAGSAVAQTAQGAHVAREPCYVIYIVSQPSRRFGYLVQGHCAVEKNAQEQKGMATVSFQEERIRWPSQFDLSKPPEVMRVFNISMLYAQFSTHLGISA